MTIRSALAICAVTTGIATFAGPVSAQQVQTFEAWGHIYIVPGSEIGAPSTGPDLNTAVHDRGSIAPERAYASAKTAASNSIVTPVQKTRTINVWGARIDAPAY